MKSEELGPSLLAAFAHVPDMHSPCAPDSGRPVHIRGPTAPQAVLYVPARCSRKKGVGRHLAGPPHVLFSCWRAQHAAGVRLLLLLGLEAMADRGEAQIGVHQRLEERDV